MNSSDIGLEFGHGLSSPEDSVLVPVRLHADPIHPSWLTVLTDPVRLTLLQSLCEFETATISELSRQTHASETTLRRHLEAIAALGLMQAHHGESDSERPGRPATRFSLEWEARDRLEALFEVISEPLAPAPRQRP